MTSSANGEEDKRPKPKRAMGDRNQNQRVNSWTHIEEVFLVGAVCTRWFTTGSLAPTRNKSKARADQTEIEPDLVDQRDPTKLDSWEAIKGIYDRNWQNHCRLKHLPLPAERTASALGRHFKIMKSKLSAKISFREYYLEWEMKYNIDAFNIIFGKFGYRQTRETRQLVQELTDETYQEPLLNFGDEIFDGFEWKFEEESLLGSEVGPLDMSKRSSSSKGSKRKGSFLAQNKTENSLFRSSGVQINVYNTIRGDEGAHLVDYFHSKQQRSKPRLDRLDSFVYEEETSNPKVSSGIQQKKESPMKFQRQRSNIFELFDIPQENVVRKFSEVEPGLKTNENLKRQYNTVQGLSGATIARHVKHELSKFSEGV
eukprot:augustus_masked-scaffold_7-processed-gene-19.105-mRNA-1 protein AED:1.00 eAED:1.00 QI:0/-1/0/0/-1/1/1/0/369